MISESENSLFDKLAIENNSVFSQKWFTDLQPKLQKLGFYSGSKLVGGLCLLEHYRNGLKITSGPELSPHCGAFMEKTNKNSYQILQEGKYFSEALADYVINSRIRLFHIALPPFVTDVQPLIWKKFDVQPSYTYQLNLGEHFPNGIENWNFMSSDIRRRTRKTQHLSLEEAQFSNQAFQPLIRSFQRANLKTSIKLISNILESANHSLSPCKILIAKVDNKVVASVVLILNHDRSYLLMCGYLDGFSNEYLSLILYSIQFAKNYGSLYFDFEGSMNKSIERFFRQFGGELIPYWDVIKAPILINTVMRNLQTKSFLK